MNLVFDKIENPSTPYYYQVSDLEDRRVIYGTLKRSWHPDGWTAYIPDGTKVPHHFNMMAEGAAYLLAVYDKGHDRL